MLKALIYSAVILLAVPILLVMLIVLLPVIVAIGAPILLFNGFAQVVLDAITSSRN
jgi:hypothetical protein